LSAAISPSAGCTLRFVTKMTRLRRHYRGFEPVIRSFTKRSMSSPPAGGRLIPFFSQNLVFLSDPLATRGTALAAYGMGRVRTFQARDSEMNWVIQIITTTTTTYWVEMRMRRVMQPDNLLTTLVIWRCDSVRILYSDLE
jgi:hypothetical protein